MGKRYINMMRKMKGRKRERIIKQQLQDRLKIKEKDGLEVNKELEII